MCQHIAPNELNGKARFSTMPIIKTTFSRVAIWHGTQVSLDTCRLCNKISRRKLFLSGALRPQLLRKNWYEYLIEKEYQTRCFLTMALNLHGNWCKKVIGCCLQNNIAQLHIILCVTDRLIDCTCKILRLTTLREHCFIAILSKYLIGVGVEEDRDHLKFIVFIFSTSLDARKGTEYDNVLKEAW